MIYKKFVEFLSGIGIGIMLCFVVARSLSVNLDSIFVYGIGAILFLIGIAYQNEFLEWLWRRL